MQILCIFCPPTSLMRRHMCAAVRNTPMWQGVFYFIPPATAISNVRGLPVEEAPCSFGIFAMHMHENGICTAENTDDFLAAGGHYNPEACPHPAHAGDLPPLFATARGKAFGAVLTDRFSLVEIIGKSVIIHRNPDDFKTQPAGNAGERIACGTIVKALRRS